MTGLLGHFATQRVTTLYSTLLRMHAHTHARAHTHAHAHALVSTVTSSLPLLGSGRSSLSRFLNYPNLTCQLVTETFHNNKTSTVL
jgi:hypothetical protein